MAEGVPYRVGLAASPSSRHLESHTVDPDTPSTDDYWEYVTDARDRAMIRAARDLVRNDESPPAEAEGRACR